MAEEVIVAKAGTLGGTGLGAAAVPGLTTDR